jgi:hypothetical protein
LLAFGLGVNEARQQPTVATVDVSANKMHDQGVHGVLKFIHRRAIPGAQLSPQLLKIKQATRHVDVVHGFSADETGASIVTLAGSFDDFAQRFSEQFDFSATLALKTKFANQSENMSALGADFGRRQVATISIPAQVAE